MKPTCPTPAPRKPQCEILHWGSKPTPGPNTSVFASQWNIDLRVHFKNHITMKKGVTLSWQVLKYKSFPFFLYLLKPNRKLKFLLGRFRLISGSIPFLESGYFRTILSSKCFKLWFYTGRRKSIYTNPKVISFGSFC